VTKHRTERRKQERFKTMPGAHVEFYKSSKFNFSKPKGVHTASLIDISKKGLSFRYDGYEMWSTDFSKVAISYGNDDIRIDHVSFKVISDHVISIPGRPVPVRRCGVQFTQLSSQTQFQINQLFRSLATNEGQSFMKSADNAPGDKTKGFGSFYYVEIEKR